VINLEFWNETRSQFWKHLGKWSYPADMFQKKNRFPNFSNILI